MATNNFDEKIQRVCYKLQNSQAIMIGGGAGLSAAAGLDYSGPAFKRAFADYIEKYGFPDLYSSSFYDFPTEEERWARWARHVEYARFLPEAFPLYKKLLRLAAGRNYFVITTNVDGQFVKAGFDPVKVFEVQGDYGLMQCARGCHDQLYSNEQLVKNMIEQTKNFAIPSSMVPHCPQCGGPMDIHVRKNGYFVEDAQWHAAEERYENFINANMGRDMLLLELGVGFNTPGIIRYPFEYLAARNRNILLVRINSEDDEASALDNIVIFKNDINEVIDAIAGHV